MSHLSERARAWLGYGTAVASSAAAFVVRNALGAPNRPMFVLLLAPVVLSGQLGGLGPALLATALVSAGAAWLVLHVVTPASPLADIVQLVVLFGLGIAIAIAMERLRRSADLRRSSERERFEHDRLREFGREAPIGIALARDDGSLEWVNDQYLRIIGYSREEFVTGRIRWDFVTPPDSAELDRHARDLLRHVGAFRYANHLVHRDGHRVPVLVGLAAQQSGIAAFVLDQTDQKAIEEALRRAHAEAASSEHRLRLALDAARMGSFSCDIATGDVTWDEQAQDIFGMSGTERFSFQRGLAMIHPADFELVRAAAAASLSRNGDGMLDVEYRVVRPDGSIRWVVTRGRVQFEGHGAARRAVQAIGIHRDITGQKEAEAALQLANQRLAEADRRKDEFLGVLSHELRNPLGPISNSLYLMRHGEPGSEQSVRAREIIERQTRHMTRIVDDLLDITRITRGKVRLRRERVDLGALVRATVDDYRALFAPREVRLTVETPDEPLEVEGDPTRLAQILGNLLHNASKYARSHGETVVSLAREGDAEAVLRVRDDGAGIEPTVMPHVFEPFQQGGAAPGRAPAGLGLGLALVAGLVQLHGGTVNARSAGREQGAEFEVRLPAGSVERSETAAVPPALESGGPRRLLVIEDNVDAADSLRVVLELAGHEVEVALTGSDGLTRARQLNPDAVLCDIGLPDMSGYDVARAIRAETSLEGMLLVAVTGFGTAADQERALAAGFDVHVTKPAGIEPLKAIIARSPSRGSGTPS